MALEVQAEKPDMKRKEQMLLNRKIPKRPANAHQKTQQDCREQKWHSVFTTHSTSGNDKTQIARAISFMIAKIV